MKFEVIGEIGVNHNGSLSEAKKLVTFLAECKVDFAKIQVFDPKLLSTSNAGLAEYQTRKRPTYSDQHGMLQSLTLNRHEVQELDSFALEQGIRLLATPFDLASLDFLVNDLNHTNLKVLKRRFDFRPLVVARIEN